MLQAGLEINLTLRQALCPPKVMSSVWHNVKRISIPASYVSSHTEQLCYNETVCQNKINK